MPPYKNKYLSTLEKTLLSGPRFARIQYADRLEQLILSIRKDSVFSLEYIYFKITGFRPTQELDAAISGSELTGDLTLLLENLSKHSPLNVTDIPEPVLTSEDVAQSFNVSTRTIYRWRRRGLPARIYVFSDGKKRAGIRESSVKRFRNENRRFIARSSQFKRISGKEREQLIKMLRQTINARGCSPTEAEKLVAAKTGRAPESLRLLMHNRAGKDTGDIRPRPPLSDEEKLAIFRSMRAGATAAELAAKYQKSRQTIYRAVNAVRARKLLRRIPEPGKIVLPEQWTDEEWHSAPELPRWTGEDMENAFLPLNLLKKRISMLRSQIKPKRYVQATLLDELELMARTREIIEFALLKRHLHLLIDTAKYHAGRKVALHELISTGIDSFFDSVHDFDYRTNHDFRHFARLRLLKKFALVLPESPSGTLNTTTGLPQTGEREKTLEMLTALLKDFAAGINNDAADYAKSFCGVEFDLKPQDLEKLAACLGVREKP